MHLHAALITSLTILLITLAMFFVGRARGIHGVHAPAITGHPDFERAFRAHQNTLEQALMFLPALWLATLYGKPFYAAILGYVWVLARVAYLFGYMKDAKKRSLGFLVSFLAFVVLWGMGLWGIVAQLVH